MPLQIAVCKLLSKVVQIIKKVCFWQNELKRQKLLQNSKLELINLLIKSENEKLKLISIWPGMKICHVSQRISKRVSPKVIHTCRI